MAGKACSGRQTLGWTTRLRNDDALHPRAPKWVATPRGGAVGIDRQTLCVQSRLLTSVELPNGFVSEEAQMHTSIVRCDSNAPSASSMIRRIVRAQRPHSALHPKHR